MALKPILNIKKKQKAKLLPKNSWILREKTWIEGFVSFDLKQLKKTSKNATQLNIFNVLFSKSRGF